MIALALLLALAAPDAATVEARRHFEAGRADYDLGHFDEALAEFEAAYRVKPLPAFLFNIGQCHFQNRDHQKAVFFYERYLELVPDADNRVLVQELLAEARRESRPLSERLFLHDDVDDPPRSSRTTTEERIDDDPQPWLWIGVGGAAVALAVSGAVVLALWPQQPEPGSLGTLDGRSR